MSEDRLDSEKIGRVLNHPVRARIIELLAVRPMSWKELSTELGVRTGSLYHHIDTLERLVTRDSERRYTLTRLGREVFAQLSDDGRTRVESIQSIEKVMRRRTVAGVARDVLVPRSFIVSLTSTRARGLASLALASLLSAALLVFSRNELVLFSFSPSPSALASLGTYAGSLAALSAVAFVALSVGFNERGDALVLAAATAFSFIPLCLFGAGLRLLYPGSGTGSPASFLTSGAAVTLLFAFFQAWGAGVIGAGMSVASGVRVEKALIVSLVVLYASMLLILVQGGRLT